jgi:hypothetical protein
MLLNSRVEAKVNFVTTAQPLKIFKDLLPISPSRQDRIAEPGKQDRIPD